MTACTTTLPGSLMPGVPASVMSATVLPPIIASTMPLHASRSVWSFTTMYFGEVMPMCLTRRPEWRESSQAMRSACSSTCFIRSEMSPRFPMGVATRMSCPLMMRLVNLERIEFQWCRQPAGSIVAVHRCRPQEHNLLSLQEEAVDFF